MLDFRGLKIRFCFSRFSVVRLNFPTSGSTVEWRAGRKRFGGGRVSLFDQQAVVLDQTSFRSRRVAHGYGVAPVGRAASALLDLLFGLKLPAPVRTNLALAAGHLAARP